MQEIDTAYQVILFLEDYRYDLVVSAGGGMSERWPYRFYERGLGRLKGVGE
jgi:hypothetical protein